ncbi:MAG: VWA domain-containing protein [Deltaproteobacteria bacterium]|nr:VWA domain-containing protein [Deltaproteobacteria bacterium]
MGDLPRGLAWCLLATTVALACGAKTGLMVDEEEDATPEGDAAPAADLCVELPHDERPGAFDLSFAARLASAEVTLLVDVTGSMAGEIDRIRSTLRDVIVPGMIRTIPAVRLSVAFFADFPVEPYGYEWDVPFALASVSTDDREATQAAVDGLPSMFGMDGPESQVEALFQLATGLGRGRYVPPARCPPGTVGYACYGPVGARLVVLFTDAMFHNGVTPWPARYDPELLDPPPATFDEAVSALQAAGIRVVGVWSDPRNEPEDLLAVAAATGAVTADGAPIVRRIDETGGGLDDGVVDAVRAFAEERLLDVDVLLEDVPGDDRDAREFVASVVALRAEPPEGATIGGGRFLDVRPGTLVVFRLHLRGDTFPPDDETRRYRLRVVLCGDGVIRLQETIVEFVVPGRLDGGCPAS